MRYTGPNQRPSNLSLVVVVIIESTTEFVCEVIDCGYEDEEQ